MGARNRCVLESSSHLGIQVVRSQESDVLLRAGWGASPNPATRMARLVHLMRTMTLVWQVMPYASVAFFEVGIGRGAGGDRVELSFCKCGE